MLPRVPKYLVLNGNQAQRQDLDCNRLLAAQPGYTQQPQPLGLRLALGGGVWTRLLPKMKCTKAYGLNWDLALRTACWQAMSGLA